MIEESSAVNIAFSIETLNHIVKIGYGLCKGKTIVLLAHCAEQRVVKS